MTFKKPTGAGLLALALGALFALFLGISVIDHAYAEEAAAAFVYDAIVSLITLKIVDIFIGLRVSDEMEREGLDLALHGETVH